MEKRTSKLQVYLNDSELDAIDEWRFKNRQPSRAAAIRALICKGLFGDQADETNASAQERADNTPSRGSSA